MRKSGIAVWALCVFAAAALLVFTGTDASIFLFTASVVLPPAQLLLAALAARSVSAEFTLPTTVKKGEQAVGMVVIRNRSVIPIARASVDIELVNLLTRETRVLTFSCPLTPCSSAELPFVFESAYCGQLVFTRSGTRISDCLGLYSPKSRETPPAPLRRIVVPELFSSDVRLSSREIPSGDEASRYLNKKGWDRSEVFQLRDYAEGDSQKQIHRKLTAKYGRPIVSDPSEPIERTLLVFWDPTGIPPSSPPTVPDALAEALITVCAALAEGGIPYSLAWRSGVPGHPAIKDVAGLDDLYAAVPELLAPSAEEEDGGAFDGLENWSLVAYFSGRVIPEADELQANVSAFICTVNAEIPTGADDMAVVFSPEDYRSVLSDVMI
jgi:uncharacterized protein (DUF58 family)